MTTHAAPIDLLTVDPDQRQHLALRGLAVRTRLAGMGERTTVEQTFANRGDRPLEPIYTFPLPADAAVCGFQVITDDRVLSGEVDETEKAQEQYEDAVERGDGAYLLERERDDVFTVRVGQLKPGQVATVRIEYVRELQVVDRQVRFELPTTMAPRFVDGAGMDPCDALLEGDAVNPPKSFAVPFGLSFECEIDLGRKVRVSSPTHQLSTEQLAGTACRTRLADGQVRPDRAIVLQLDLHGDGTGDDQPCAQRATGPSPQAGADDAAEATYLSVSFLPEFEARTDAQAPADVVFLIDCSGSMHGSSIEQARRALELCVRTLRAGDHFQIVRFGSSFQALSQEPLRYGPQTFEQTLHAVRQIEADLGGTELHGALQHVLAQRPAAGCAHRDVVLLTDGQVSNEDAVLALARDHAATHRVFTFGIGPAYSDALVTGLARVTGGAAERIALNERIEDKVLRTFGRLDSPQVRDVRLEWHGDWHGGTEPELARDDQTPPLFDGDAVTFRACCASGAVPEAVTLHCTAAGQPQSFRIELPREPQQGSPAATLWARQRIGALEDAQRGHREASRFTKQREDRRRLQLVTLGRRFGLLSSATAYFAVEHRSAEQRAKGEPALQRVPVQMPIGWGGAVAQESGFMDLKRGRPRMQMPCAAPEAPRRSRKRSAPGVASKMADLASRAFGGGGRDDEDLAMPAASPLFEAELSEGAVDDGGDALFDLLARQDADGAFDLPDLALDAELEAALAGLDLLRAADAAQRSRLRDTLGALAILARDHADRRAIWRRAADKAEAWLRDTLGCDAPTLDAALAGLR